MSSNRLGARDGTFTLDGRRTYLYDGELHYFRVRSELWRPGLERLKAAGMNAVSTYIPWVWHEPEEGFFDFNGATKKMRDLALFLELAKDTGLVVMARPGPLVYAEFDGLGIPLWLGDRYPDSVVRRRDGTKERGEFFWNHSLMHPTYRAKVRTWYEQLARFLAPFWNDPVITFQLDNETGLLFANQLGRIDFNPDTLARYRDWLSRRYDSIEAVSAAWGIPLRSFAQIVAPRPPLRQPEIADWQLFLESWIDEYLSWLAQTAREVGVPVPLVHNEQGIQHSPLHAQDGPVRIDYFGYDIYPKASPGKYTADFPFAGSLFPGMFSAYRTPDRPTLALELGTGWFDPRAKVSDASVAQNIFGSIAHGARGLCLFTMHDGREPTGEPYEFGGPIDDLGRPTPRYRLVSDVGRFLETYGDLLLDMEEIHDPVGYGIYFPNMRFAAEDYFQGTDQIDPHRYLTFLAYGGLHALLLCAGMNPYVVDVRELDAKPLADLQILLFATRGMLEPEVYSKLENYVLGGGHLITAPGPPDRDLWGRPSRYGSLFPLEPSETRRLDVKRVWWTILKGGIPYWLHERPWLSDRHRSSQHILDIFEPLLDSLRTPVRGQLLRVRPTAPTGDEVPDVPDADPPSIPGDFVCHTFPLPKDRDSGIRPGPLWLGDKPAAYEVDYGWGTSTVLGTLPAGRYLTSRYYAMSDAERKALRQFARGLLAQRGVVPRIHADVEAEIVGHAGERGGMLFLINRLGAQAGDVRFTEPETFGYAGQLEVAYTLAGSHAHVVNRRTIHVELKPDDVLVLRLY
ncbi:MAG: beta-galactosidase [Candidatus Eiseniibacteriota bacterium]